MSKQLKLFVSNIEESTIRPPLRYPGSKYNALKIIKNFLPEEKIESFCEPFFGSGAFFFKLINCNESHINDYDHNLINFYKIIKNTKLRKELIKNVSKFRPSKKEFNSLRSKKFKNKFDQACQYFIINRTAYSGIMNRPNWGYHPKKSVQPLKWGNRIESSGRKLKDAKLTSFDFRLFFKKKLFKKKTFLFIDPPYFKADQKRAYFKSFTEEDHMDLSKILKNLDNKFLLTYDNCREIKKLYAWANVSEVSWRYHTANSNNTSRKMGNELIIKNY